MLRVTGIKLLLDEDNTQIINQLARKLKVNKREILGYKIFRESLDARKKHLIHFVYTVDVELKDERSIIKRLKDEDVAVTPPMEYEYVKPGHVQLKYRPVIVGTGPAGL